MTKLLKTFVVVLMAASIAGCGGSGSPVSDIKSGSSRVTVYIGSADTYRAGQAAGSSEAFPATLLGISEIVILVDGAPVGLPIDPSQISAPIILEIPNGQRTFRGEVRRKSDGALLLYSEEVQATLPGDNIVFLEIINFANPPEPPANISVAQNTGLANSVRISWDPATDPVSSQMSLQYLIFVSEGQGQQQFKNADGSDVTTATCNQVPGCYIASPGQTTFVAGGFSAGTYYFLVRAQNEGDLVSQNNLDYPVVIGQ